MTCDGKQSFLTFGLADSTSKRSNNRHAGFRLQPYRCRECGSWHIGSSIGRRQTRGGHMTVVEPEAA